MFLYIFLLFLLIVFVKNFSFFKSFWSNFKSYYFVTNLKTSDEINFFSWKNFSKLELDLVDKINLKILSKDFSWALENYFSNKKFSYKDYYNIWNIFLLDSYFWFWKKWYIQDIQNAITYYDISIKNAPNYVDKFRILKNNALANSVLNFSYVYFCDHLFLKMISETSILLKKLDKLVSILKRQLVVLNKRYYFDDLKRCIDSLKSDANKNIYLVYENKKFFSNVKRWLFYKLIDFNHNERDCYQKRNLIIGKYADSIKNSIEYFDKFYKLQDNLLKVYSWATYTQMKLLCDNKSKIAKNLAKENKKMQKNYQNLSDLANKPKPHRKHKNKEQTNNKSSENKLQKNDKSKNKQQYSKQFEEYTKSVLDSLIRKNKDIIKQIMNEKSQDVFNPKVYIDRLFKKFNWKQDYYLEKKVQTSGK